MATLARPSPAAPAPGRALTGPVTGAWWYRFSTTWPSRRSGYLALVLVIGLLGGLGMGALAAARRTQSSYPTFLASTNPSDLTVSIYGPNGGPLTTPITSEIARLPGVVHVRTVASPQVVPLNRAGAPRLGLLNTLTPVGSLNGLTVVQDRLTAVAGRLADPARADQVMVTATAARVIGVHVGQVLPLGIYAPGQEELPGFGTARVPPRRTVRARVSGIVVLNSAVVQDDTDNQYGFLLFTPALMAEAARISPSNTLPALYGIQLRHPRTEITAVERAITALVPPRNVYNFHLTSRTIAQTELAVKPESVALGGFGAIALLVCLVLGIQGLARLHRSGDDDRRILRSLGAGPVLAGGDGVLGAMLTIVAGALLAVALAVALSPLAPLGPVRAVYPAGGPSFDATVLLGGLAALVVVFTVAEALLAIRAAPHRLAPPATRQPRSVAGRAEAAGLPVSAVVGTRFALEPGGGRTAVPVRFALVGAVVAVATVVTTLTFSASLRTLATTPSLYGWNWNYALVPTNSVPPKVLALLSRDHDVAAWSGYVYENAWIDGQSVPFLASNLHPAVAPPILSGDPLTGKDQIILGSATLAALHKQVGDTVTLSFGNPADAPLYVPPTRLRIVGTATLPAIGYSSYVADHTSMGTGAWFPLQALPSRFLHAASGSDPNLQGPPLVFVRMRTGLVKEAALSNLRAIARAANRVFDSDPNTLGNGITITGVQRPAQIVNYRSVGATPVVLAVGLAAGAVVALGFTLFGSVRRRRHDLALLKALGFTPGQLRAVVAWQGTVAALVGVIVGLPLGIVAGRILWDAFARSLNAVPEPTVPMLAVAAVALGALLFANLVSALPGTSAARTSTAVLLRTD